jgi:hypothetical protein
LLVNLLLSFFFFFFFSDLNLRPKLGLHWCQLTPNNGSAVAHATETADRERRLGKAAHAAEQLQKKAASEYEQFQKTQLDIFAERILSETEKQAALGVKRFDIMVTDDKDFTPPGTQLRLRCSALVLHNVPDLQDQLTMRGLKSLSVKLHVPTHSPIWVRVAVENKAVAVGVESTVVAVALPVENKAVADLGVENKDENTIERRPAAANKWRRHLNTGRAQYCALQ